MSESSSAERYLMDPARRDAGRPAADVDEVLALCLEATAQPADPARLGAALDSLETLLPTLVPADLETLLGNPDYRAVRSDLLRNCAAAWLDRECRLARRALDGPECSTLSRLFGGHIPREAYADELAVLASLQPQRILILGSGPCPMSAIVIQDAFPAATIVGLDRSREACTLSAQLLSASGYAMVEVRHGDAGGPIDIDRFDCILMALTVGEDEAAKRRVIAALRNGADTEATLVVRTAVGWGRVLYPAVDIPPIAARAARQTVRTSYQRSVAVPIRMAELPT